MSDPVDFSAVLKDLTEMIVGRLAVFGLTDSILNII
jgi:hypothetical protein